MSDRSAGKLSPQVDRSLYVSPGYINPGRFASYAYQIREVLELQPESVLEVGIGNGLVSYMLRKAGIDVTTLDFDESLEPNVVASVTDMPVPDNSFDVVACFEVLEHIPYGMVPSALSEIHRVCAKHALLSLPDARPAVRFRVPRLGPRQFLIELPFWTMREHRFNGEHHWTVNTKGCPLHQVLAAIEHAGFTVQETWRPWENPAHRFFRLGRKDV
ncbi:MAG: class I SAM-dependent methyltransferase [Planctomycetes bacterium]|nr:class I SAM-dependent methyltransferase [Planctomycetota bacterium]